MIPMVILISAQAVSGPSEARRPGSASSLEAQAVLEPINALFAAIKAKDGGAILAIARPEGRVTAVIDPGTVKTLSWSAYAETYRSGIGPSFEERFDGRPLIQVDGDVASVWARYNFFADRKLVACGVDHFDIIRDGRRWKLLNVTWSQYKPGHCSR